MCVVRRKPQKRAIERTASAATVQDRAEQNDDCLLVVVRVRSLRLSFPFLSYPGAEAGRSWVDASRDDIQLSAAASNGGVDSQRVGSIGEARGREWGRTQDANARCRTRRYSTVCRLQQDARLAEEPAHTTKTSSRSNRSKTGGAGQYTNLSHKVGRPNDVPGLARNNQASDFRADLWRKVRR